MRSKGAEFQYLAPLPFFARSYLNREKRPQYCFSDSERGCKIVSVHGKTHRSHALSPGTNTQPSDPMIWLELWLLLPATVQLPYRWWLRALNLSTRSFFHKNKPRPIWLAVSHRRKKKNNKKKTSQGIVEACRLGSRNQIGSKIKGKQRYCPKVDISSFSALKKWNTAEQGFQDRFG